MDSGAHITAPVTSNSGVSDSLNSNYFIKFHGLIQENLFSVFLKDLIQFVNYSYSVSSPLLTVHKIMSFFRIIQFVMPTLIPCYDIFWVPGSIEYITNLVLSVFYYILPPSVSFQSTNVFLYIYCILQFIVLLMILISTIYFNKMAKLHSFIPKILSFYHSTLGYYFPVLVVYLIAESISYNIWCEQSEDYSSVTFYVLASISVVLLIIHLCIMNIILSQTLVFRTMSLMTATSPPHTIIFSGTLAVNFFFGLGSQAPKIVSIILLAINAVIYLLCIISAYYKGGFIDDFISNFVVSSSVTGAVFCVVDLVLIVLNKHGSLPYLFSFILFFLVMVLVNYFIKTHLTISELSLLDSIEKDETEFNKISSANSFLQIALTGIKYAHPIIIDLQFFNIGSERWSTDPYVWLLFSKFISLYPEETITLILINRRVSSLKLKGQVVRCIKEQSIAVAQTREQNVSPELKSKLTNLQKETQATKHKLRHVWDVVIQGNITEVETATRRALKAISQTHADYKHLLRQFPNNRNVARPYDAFIKEILNDHALSAEMQEKMRLLQRGIFVTIDQTSEYGLLTFPNLPDHNKKVKEQPIMLSTQEAAQSLIVDNNNLEKERRIDIDQLTNLKTRIEELTIPSISGSIILRIIISLIFFVLPCIAGLIYLKFYEHQLKDPLDFLGSLSLLRTYSYQVISFSLRYIGEKIGVFPSFSDYPDRPPVNLGNSWSTAVQLKFIIETTSKALQDFSSFKKFQPTDFYVQQAQELIFKNTFEYKYYITPTNITSTMVSVQAVILDFTLQQSLLIDNNDFTKAILNESIVLNPMNNIYPLTDSINLALDLLIQYIQQNCKDAKKYGFICLGVLTVVELLAYGITLFIELRWIRLNKQEAYQCLLSLPKNLVSDLSEKLGRTNKELIEENTTFITTEMNKQDENILKIFNSGGTSEVPLSDVFTIATGTIFIFLFSVGVLILFVLLVIDLAQTLQDSAPHLNYLQGSYAMMLSSLNWIHSALFTYADASISDITAKSSFEKAIQRLNLSRDYYHLSSYGGTTNSQEPFKGFSDAVVKASDESSKECSISNSSQSADNIQNPILTPSGDYVSLPENLGQLIHCYPIDMAFVLFEPLIRFALYPIQEHIIDSLDSTDPLFSTLWVESISPLYDLFFYPMHQAIKPIIEEELTDSQKVSVPIIITLLVAGIAIEALIIFQICLINGHIHSVLGLLLHCKSSEVVFNTPKIMKVLSGDFSTKRSDAMNRDSEFFDSVFINLPDAIMYANSEMIIQDANRSCQRTFGNVELIGQSIKDFFMSKRFSGNIEALFTSASTNPTQQITYETDDKTKLYLDASSMYAGGKFVMSCRNVTQAYRYKTLITDERAKSDKLLETILPPSLVKRVQEGEKNISFAVQSASILFSDIVEFTPWCGSLPAEKVMMTLNILFKRFDAILATKPTMTKIKCIGDCYMAAGGIFSEMNQPFEHAKDVVSFGIESIEAIRKINEEIKEKLKIRVGVNSGGPIVAGVLGIGKPTFEILGPAINLAQQMEHTGVPMQVHITRAVYELIYNGNFKIHERGKIEVKGGEVITYLVKPNTDGPV